DPQGGVWFTNVHAKLIHYADGHFENVPLPQTEPAAGIYGLLVDPDDPLLIPSSNGVLRLDHGQWSVLDNRNGLPCDRIFSMVKDRYGSVWLYAQCGLLRIDAAEFARWRRDPKTIVAVMALDGRD